MKYLSFPTGKEPVCVRPESGIFLRQTPTQYSNKTSSPFFASTSHTGLRGKRGSLCDRATPWPRYSVNVTPCRTIKYSAALLRWTLRYGCRFYLFVCDESLPSADRTPSIEHVWKRAIERREAREGDIFFLSGNAANNLFTQIWFWPKKSRIKLINYKSSLRWVSFSLSLFLSHLLSWLLAE